MKPPNIFDGFCENNNYFYVKYLHRCHYNKRDKYIP